MIQDFGLVMEAFALYGAMPWAEVLREVRLDFQSNFLGNPFIVMSWVVQLYLVTTSSCFVEVIQIFLEACPTLGLLSLLFSVMDCECRGFVPSIYPSFPFAIGSFLFFSFWGSFSPNCRRASSFWEFGVSSNSAYFLFDFNHFKPLRFCFLLFFLCVKPSLKRFGFLS